MRETWVPSLGRDDALEKEMAIHSSTIPGKSHGQKSLVGYSPWNSPGQNTGVGGYPLFPFPGDLPDPGMEPRSPALQVDSLPAEPQGKPKNTGMGSLSLLQGIFLTQESN